MVALSHLVLALSVIASSLAAPSPVQKRGPHNFVMGPDHPLIQAKRNLTMSRRASTDYNQDYTTGGTVYFAPASGEFYVSWDTTDDFVVGVGWNPGSTEYRTSLLLLDIPISDFSLPGQSHMRAASLLTRGSRAYQCMVGRQTRLSSTTLWTM